MATKNIICPNQNCGYQGPAEEKARGSTVLLIILLLLWIVPGLIYLGLRSGYKYSCPKCGLDIASD